ncbi:MAG: metallophosphoesterase [Planctomycetota bacterium]|nr:metallophosphoesterase [Planctomycetota bacterium]
MITPTRLLLPEGSLVLTDLHVDCASPVEVAEFEDLLERAAGAPVLLLLGDLFEYWLGPSQVTYAGAPRVLAALSNFPGQTYLIPGNRDVLGGRELEAALGSPLLWHGCLAQLDAGHQVLFLHGDELCLDDRPYLRLRRFLRNPLVRTCLRALPGFLGHRLARRLRRSSANAIAARAPLEVAQDPAEAGRRLTASGAEVLVVGHTHAWREVPTPGGGTMFVLDALGGPRDLLRIPGVDDHSLDFCASAGLGGSASG